MFVCVSCVGVHGCMRVCMCFFSGETATSTNLSSETNQRFLWESLCSRCIPSHDGGRLDIFAALASNGMLEKIMLDNVICAASFLLFHYVP